MLARILDILTDDFHDFPKSLQTGEYLRMDYEHLLLQLSFYFSLIIKKVDARHTHPLTEWMNDLVNRSVR